ncbi:MAG: hypothetical protein WCJ80_01675 [Bacteroidota bacterium]
MKHLSVFCFICMVSIVGRAQVVIIDTSNTQTKDTLLKKQSDSTIVLTDSVKPLSIPDSVALRRNILNKTNMTILLAWSGANLVQGSISAGNLVGSPHYFHQMNAYFNIVNLAIAGYGLYEVRKQMNKKLSLYQNLRQQQKIESLLLLNSGLDLTYITTGLYLRERGTNKLNDQTKGYGGSLILQGSFLLVFDIIQYIQHRQNGQLLNKYLGNLQLATTSNGVALVLPL